jgi:hypothetical protein
MDTDDTSIPRQRSLSSSNLNSIWWTAAVTPTKVATYNEWRMATGMVHWADMWQRLLRGFFIWITKAWINNFIRNKYRKNTYLASKRERLGNVENTKYVRQKDFEMNITHSTEADNVQQIFKKNTIYYIAKKDALQAKTH